jgi:hypothetical protein
MTKASHHWYVALRRDEGIGKIVEIHSQCVHIIQTEEEWSLCGHIMELDVTIGVCTTEDPKEDVVPIPN